MKARSTLIRPIMGAVALCAAALLAGCSEAPRVGALAWEPLFPDSTLQLKAGLAGVVALGPMDAVAVGHSLPGSVNARPVALLRSGGRWTLMSLPDDRSLSIQLLGVARTADGTIWACGGSRTSAGEATTSTPVIYRLSGGVWTRVWLSEAGDTTGVELKAIAAGGDELRAVGTAYTLSGDHGVVYRYSGGHWTATTPTAPTGGAGGWALTSVARSASGTWFAAGAPYTGSAVVYTDTCGCGGWQAQTVSGPQGLQLTSLAVGGGGTLWVGGNYPTGDSLQGALFRGSGSSFARVNVARASAGSFRVYALGFDTEGHGWAVGGRFPDDPFFAYSDGSGSWTEFLSEVDSPTVAAAGRIAASRRARPFGMRGVREEESGGGELFCVCVLDAENAIAVGQAEERGEGGVEVELLPRAFQFLRKAPGEVDKPVRLTQPR